MSTVCEADLEVVQPAQTLYQAMANGAVWGITMWSAYALVEFLLYSAMPVLTGGAVVTPNRWRLNALAFDGYWILGALFGALSGALVNRWCMRSIAGMQRRPDLTRLPATLSLLLAVLINLLSAIPLRKVAQPMLVMVLALGSATVWALVRPKSRLSGWVNLHPMILAVLILGPTWILSEVMGDPGLVQKCGAILLLIGTMFGIHALLHRRSDWSGSRHLAAYLVYLTAATAACAMISGANRAALVAAPPMKGDPGTAPIILVSLDTTRADHLSAYGYARQTTPNLAEFARSATLYTSAMAASDFTLPSHASMFTGFYPSWHGARTYSTQRGLPHPLDKRLPTLAGILASHGYFTAAVAANSAYLTPTWGLHRGFQTYDEQRTVDTTGYTFRYNLQYVMRRILDCWIDTTGFDTLYRRADEVNDSAFSILERTGVLSRSFFLFVNYMDAHVPYVAPKPYDRLFLGMAKPVDYPTHRVIRRDLFQKGIPVPSDVHDRLIAQYDGGVAYQDVGLGHLMAWLKQRGVYDKSLIIVTGDHGEAFGERGLIEHGVSVYQDQVHVPLLIKYPNQTAASVVAAPVSHVDVLPTVLDVLGYPIPANLQGHTLRDPSGLEKRLLFAESFPIFRRITNGRLDRIERAVRSGSLKLILSTSGKYELYDLANDPDELHNLKATPPAGAQGLEAALRGWIASAPPADTGPPGGWNKEEIERLKGLGYIQ